MRMIHSAPATSMAMKTGPRAQSRTAPKANGANARINRLRTTTAVWQTCPKGDCEPVQTARTLRLPEWWFAVPVARLLLLTGNPTVDFSEDAAWHCHGVSGPDRDVLGRMALQVLTIVRHARLATNQLHLASIRV